ncbi:cell wall protein-like [Oryza sativa Japonica Group]|uniref:Cell wall protein-like n=1 Tax=Oryza sativa subsp. japonica TaxID=39947 RepID=Q5SMR5_ORYSJ|nr:cell wall protein-like [Oryza sativa Japonica Group]BAD72491.1 cell wall protein-like [Oryza sativa Japonica Group]
MPPPIAGNGRAKSGRLPLPPAGFSTAVPTSPVAGSLFSHIKWDPRTPFYRFNPIPSLPVVSSPVPAVALLFPSRRPPPAAFLSSPEHRPAVPSPPSALQHRPLHRPHRLLAGNSPERCPRRQPVALVPLYSLQPAAVHRRCADRRRRLLLRHRGIAFFPGITSSSPEFRRNAVARAGLSFLLGGISSGCPFRHARASAGAAVPSLGMVTRDVVLGLASPPTEHRRGVFHVILVPVQPLPAVLVASSPAPVVVALVLSSFPIVVAPVLVFVLGSASSSLVPAASRLRPRIAAEAVPSPFVSVVPVCLRRARSSLSFPRLVAWW